MSPPADRPTALRDKTGSHGRLPSFTQKHVLKVVKVVTVDNVKSTLTFKVMVEANVKVRVALHNKVVIVTRLPGYYMNFVML